MGVGGKIVGVGVGVGVSVGGIGFKGTSSTVP